MNYNFLNETVLGGKMKKFFHDYSYSIVKMFVNQFAIAIFGLSLFTATTLVKYVPALSLVTSIGSIIFYLFLIYILTWEIGAKDRISVDVGKKPYRPHTGLLLSLIANIPNLLLAILCTILEQLRPISLLLNAMYWGMIKFFSISNFAITYYLMIVPALVTCWVAYIMGFKNIRLVAKPPKSPQDNKPNLKK